MDTHHRWRCRPRRFGHCNPQNQGLSSLIGHDDDSVRNRERHDHQRLPRTRCRARVWVELHLQGRRQSGSPAARQIGCRRRKRRVHVSGHGRDSGWRMARVPSISIPADHYQVNGQRQGVVHDSHRCPGLSVQDNAPVQGIGTSPRRRLSWRAAGPEVRSIGETDHRFGVSHIGGNVSCEQRSQFDHCWRTANRTSTARVRTRT